MVSTGAIASLSVYVQELSFERVSSAASTNYLLFLSIPPAILADTSERKSLRGFSPVRRCEAPMLCPRVVCCLCLLGGFGTLGKGAEAYDLLSEHLSQARPGSEEEVSLKLCIAQVCMTTSIPP